MKLSNLKKEDCFIISNIQGYFVYLGKTSDNRFEATNFRTDIMAMKDFYFNEDIEVTLVEITRDRKIVIQKEGTQIMKLKDLKVGDCFTTPGFSYHFQLIKYDNYGYKVKYFKEGEFIDAFYPPNSHDMEVTKIDYAPLSAILPNTIVIWDCKGGDQAIRFFIIPGDKSCLNGVYINSVDCTNEQSQELSQLVYDQDTWDYRVELLENFPIEKINQFTKVIVAGICE